MPQYFPGSSYPGETPKHFDVMCLITLIYPFTKMGVPEQHGRLPEGWKDPAYFLRNTASRIGRRVSNRQYKG